MDVRAHLFLSKHIHLGQMLQIVTLFPIKHQILQGQLKYVFSSKEEI